MRPQFAYDQSNTLNAICPYFTMFPLEFPMRVLRKHKRNTPSVIDPFCGRGTTLFAARKLGLTAWGIDTSPIATAIARAKVCRSSMQDALRLAQSYIDEIYPSHVPQSAFFRRAFDRRVLREVCSIRQGLLEEARDSNASTRRARRPCWRRTASVIVSNAVRSFTAIVRRSNPAFLRARSESSRNSPVAMPSAARLMTSRSMSSSRFFAKDGPPLVAQDSIRAEIRLGCRRDLKQPAPTARSRCRAVVRWWRGAPNPVSVSSRGQACQVRQFGLDDIPSS
jgi:hypothetical protein